MCVLFKHLHTIGAHRRQVRRLCFKMGIPWQGLVHDLSKYSLEELKICKYWTGKGSPHQACREQLGYSPSWIHHYHANRHHAQYWLDDDENTGGFRPIKMPFKYVIEMYCDMVAAGKVYMKDKWTTAAPWEYYINKCKGKRLQHPASEYLLAKLFWNLKEHFADDENGFIKWYKVNKAYLKQCYEADKVDY